MQHSKLSEKLKDKKLRLTEARKEIYSLIQKSEKSLSPREVYKDISKKSKTDLVSVYRNLALFDELGLAHRFQDGKYSSCHHDHQGEHNHHDHVHFINLCTSCGKSSEIKEHSKNICELAKQIKKISPLLESHQEIVIQGKCSHCLKKS